MTHSAVIKIENQGGIWVINDKRLGHDKLTKEELKKLNEFIKEFKNQ